MSIYDELSAERLIDVPRFDGDETRTDLTAVTGRIEYAGAVDYAWPSGDGWCEDRSPAELSDDDGRD